MKHDEIRERLHEYADGELDAAAAAAVAEHLAECSECRAVLDAWKRLSQNLFQALPAPEEAFVGRVMARIAEEELELDRAPSSGGWWLVPAFAAAAVVSLMWWPGQTSAAEDPLSDETAWELSAQPTQAEDVLDVAAGERP
ncbi:MAG: zf-HC2 domain-containing protein [Elusimicrobia bacterium]|nr:zf-HC2 domain-containing protein [Elusimicrobiota bacterium]